MIARSVVVLCVVVMLASCVVHVRPPLDVRDPVTVHIVDYGDWAWYAKDQQSVLYGAVVFVVPTQGALGRRATWIGPGFATWGDDGVTVHPIVVKRDKAIALSDALAARYASQQSTEHFNVERDIRFVHDDADYWLGHQSTSQAGDWLRDLGCEVSGFALVAEYEIEGR